MDCMGHSLAWRTGTRSSVGLIISCEMVHVVATIVSVPESASHVSSLTLIKTFPDIAA